MRVDPSEEEGSRTFSSSERPADDPCDPEHPTIARASLGWSLVALGVLIGFAVGGRIGSADGGSHPRPAIVSDSAASESVIEATRGTLAAEVMAAVAAREAGLEIATRGAAADADSSDRSEAADDGYSLASATRLIPIDKLPIYEDEFSDEYEAEFSESSGHEGPGGAPSDPASSDPVSDETDASYARDAASQGAGRSLTIVTRGKIGRGDSLGASLQRQGVSPSTVHLIAAEMRQVFDFRHSRPGDAYRLGQDSDGRVLDFRYSQSVEESYYLSWNGTDYTVVKETADLRPQIAKIAGIVDSSFYGAVLALGEQSALAAEFTRILAWDIDFSRAVHPGDEFQILYERLYRKDKDGRDVYVRPGKILAGRYDGHNGAHTVVYFEDENGHGAYFRPDGSSIERAFLAAPVEFARVTSRFTWARKHPILKVTRPHPGIDYAAPHGTPIWAVAEGVVEYKARAGASGNLIRIRHQGGLTSHYAHLASFARGLKVGDRVEQKQIIGYVGSTGLSTGPHVCFRVKQDGKYVDPMKISGPAGDPVAPAQLAVFRSVRDQLLADLGPGPLNLADEAL